MHTAAAGCARIGRSPTQPNVRPLSTTHMLYLEGGVERNFEYVLSLGCKISQTQSPRTSPHNDQFCGPARQAAEALLRMPRSRSRKCRQILCAIRRGHCLSKLHLPAPPSLHLGTQCAGRVGVPYPPYPKPYPTLNPLPT